MRQGGLDVVENNVNTTHEGPDEEFSAIIRRCVTSLALVGGYPHSYEEKASKA